MPNDKSEDVDKADPSGYMDPTVEPYEGNYSCDVCYVFYGHGGYVIRVANNTMFGGYRRLLCCCKWCLIKLGITIMEVQLG